VLLNTVQDCDMLMFVSCCKQTEPLKVSHLKPAFMMPVIYLNSLLHVPGSHPASIENRSGYSRILFPFPDTLR